MESGTKLIPGIYRQPYFTVSGRRKKQTIIQLITKKQLNYSENLIQLISPYHQVTVTVTVQPVMISTLADMSLHQTVLYRRITFIYIFHFKQYAWDPGAFAFRRLLKYDLMSV